MDLLAVQHGWLNPERSRPSQEAIGAKCIDLEWVQVHPTGLVKPDDADAKIKFLAAEVRAKGRRLGAVEMLF